MNITTSGFYINSIEGVCDEESRNNTFKLAHKRKLERLAIYKWVSVGTVKIIHKEDTDRKNNPNQLLPSPGKKSRVPLR